MADAENPTAERETESAASSHLSARASSALGKPGDPVKKCGACGRKQPFKRTRCVSCGANLPETAFDEKTEESGNGGPAPEAPKAEDKAPEKAPEAATPAPEKPPEVPAPAPQAQEKPPAHAVEEPKPSDASEVTLESLIKAAAGDTPAPPPAEPEPAAAVAVAPAVGIAVGVAPDAPPVAAPKEKPPEKAPEPEAAKPEPRTPQAPTPAPGAKKPAAAPPRPGGPPPNIGAVVKGEVAPLFTKAVEHLDGKIASTAKAVDHVEHQLKAGLGLVAKGQHGLQEKVTLVARALEELAKDATKRRKDYDALYAEMHDYKVNFIDQAQKPLFNDLLLLFDSVIRISRNVDDIKDPTIPKEAVAEAFKQIKDELVEILYRRDIEMIEDHPTKLDVTFQKPVRRVETESAEEDRHVVQCVREGFKRNGVVFRPQEVVIKRCARVVHADEQPLKQPTVEPEKPPQVATQVASEPAAAPAETGKKEE